MKYDSKNGIDLPRAVKAAREKMMRGNMVLLRIQSVVPAASGIDDFYWRSCSWA